MLTYSKSAAMPGFNELKMLYLFLFNGKINTITQILSYFITSFKGNVNKLIIYFFIIKTLAIAASCVSLSLEVFLSLAVNSATSSVDAGQPRFCPSLLKAFSNTFPSVSSITQNGIPEFCALYFASNSAAPGFSKLLFFW